MEQNKKKEEISKSKNFTAPSITVTHIQMEQGITAGSAPTEPTDSNHIVKEEWEIGEDMKITIDW